MRFEDMDVEARSAAARAASRFLIDYEYVSMEEACIERDLTLQQLWDLIQAEAGLPPSEVPEFAMMA